MENNWIEVQDKMFDTFLRAGEIRVAVEKLPASLTKREDGRTYVSMCAYSLIRTAEQLKARYGLSLRECVAICVFVQEKERTEN